MESNRSHPPAGNVGASERSVLSKVRESRFAFFWQGSWMILSTAVCGMFMAAVHPVASAMPPEEYGVFVAMVRLFTVLAIPAAGLQTVFAQQAAAAVDEQRRLELCGTVKSVVIVTLIFWAAMAVAVAVFEQKVLQLFKIENPTALWMTLLTVLVILWLPVFQGVLQGWQNFFWLGSSIILNGFGRLLAIGVIVWALGGESAGAMAGAFAGVFSALLVAAVPAKWLLETPGRRQQWRRWLGRVMPLTLGMGSSLFIMNADMLVVQSKFPEEATPFYAAAAMVGVALVTLTTPLAAVMFPKIVRSLARSERSEALPFALFATFGIGLIAALFCTFLPQLPLQVMYFTNDAYLASAPLVRWFAWCMLPLTLANVLLVNLLARRHFEIVPWAVAIAAGYGIALVTIAGPAPEADLFESFRTVIQLLGLFSFLLFAVVACFSWRAARMGSPQRKTTPV